MVKDIKFTGYTTAPSDYECQDGALAAAINIIPEDGGLRTLRQPVVKFEVGDGFSVAFTHETNLFTHYILTDGGYTLKYIDKDDSTHTKKDMSAPGFEVKSINSIGNTLIVIGEYSLMFYLWNSSYKRLGNHIPEMNLSFGLQGHPRMFSQSDASRARFTISFPGMSPSQMCGSIPDANRPTITEQIMAKVNKFVAEQSVNKGRFAMPFLVRYGLRLYDGSLVMHSAPVLMNPCTTNNPVVFWTEAYSGDSASNVDHAVCDLMMMACDLDYCFNNVTSDDYEQWSDIVKSIDIFVSKPIYPFDINGKIERCNEKDDFNSTFIGKLYHKGGSSAIAEDKYLTPINDESMLNYYVPWGYDKIYALYFEASRTVPWAVFRLPEFSAEKVGESIRSTSLFYLLHSIELKDLKTTRTVIPIDNEYLQSLVTREVMTDDYQTHDHLATKFSHVYNGRVNFAGIRRGLFKGFQMSSMLAYCNSRMNFQLDGTTVKLSRPQVNWSNLTDKYSVTVHIKENGEDCVVSCGGLYDYTLSNFLSDTLNGSLSKENWGCYFYYPNSNAYKMVIGPVGNNTEQLGKSYEIALKPHDHLNGAFALLDYGLVRQSSGYYSGGHDDQMAYIDVPNKIYTSEINNPFYFPVLGINTIGTGTILGMSSATKALSQGQFGQFPLYAFTSEGVWALEVSANGTYSAKQPVTRDVCINAKSITQLDSAVLFATDRGIMMLTGSQAECITDAINAEIPFNVLRLPGIDRLHRLIGHTADTCFPIAPFLTFLRNCAMIYDYVHQRIIVFNNAYTYAYVFSLKSKEWGMMFSNIASAVNSYPDALAMSRDNKLVTFSEATAPEDSVAGLYLTRPIKLEMPDTLKTINTVIQRGMFQRGDVQTVLYGSRDLYNWFVVWSSTDHDLRGLSGSPYKYFRIAGIVNLTQDKSVLGASIQFVPRDINQLR